jgi:hypothetical protein
MEILDRIKSMVGLGKSSIALVEVGPLRRGELLQGTVLLSGGEYDAPVQDVKVRLDEQRLSYPSPGLPERQFWRHVSEEVITLDGRILKSDEVLELRFELVIPVDLEATDGAVSYALIAETEVPGLNPKAEQALTLEAE